ncbi:TIR domain-containing protein [Heracleum sosnowskyi]|uniref:TIR domain-containing protein n=1 Tax=Heracleum sosnowskyi TaxID=360622 RepID=A0AAD8I906_9APIA|nr:TIR domain-containing protein [Heracleum sosnowskyi]
MLKPKSLESSAQQYSYDGEVDETKRKNLMDKIKRWRTALTQVANLGGMPSQNLANGYESKLIQKIVNVVKNKSMGREIIRQKSPTDPGQRSRLWHYKDSLKVLKDETGTRTIEGLALEMNTSNVYQVELRTKAFSMMHKLRLLKLDNVRLSGGYEYLPRNLKWLCWHGYPFMSLPNGFPFGSLVAIDMQSSELQNLGQGNMLLGSLKFLNLSHCHGIVKTPNFAKLSALEQLLLENCANLVEIDESIGMAQGLVLINLKDCKLLKKLPENLCMLRFLKTLNISGCSNLGVLPAEMRKMDSLKVFHADGLDFGDANYTTHQNKSWREFIWGLVSIPKISPQLSLASLPCNSITRLSLVNCNLHDHSFPKDFRVAPSLESLNLSNNPIRFLPDCFKGLKKVKILELHDCNRLQILEDLPKIEYFRVLRCPLLEKITLKPGLCFESFGFPHKCDKLLEMDGVFKVVPIEKIDSELINNCGIYDVESMKTIQIRLYNNYTFADTRCPIQGLYEYRPPGKTKCSIQGVFENQRRLARVFSIFYPGSSVPTWFTSQSHVPSLSVIVSHSNLQYLNTCVVYKLNPGPRNYFYLLFHNMTSNKMFVYHPTCYGIPEGDESMTWLCHWKFGSHEVGPGDEVNISIFNEDDDQKFEVKEIGVYLVYEEQELAGVHSAKRQKIQQTCEKLSQYVIPVERQPMARYGMTRICFIPFRPSSIDSWLDKHFGKFVPVLEAGEPSSLDRELE